MTVLMRHEHGCLVYTDGPYQAGGSSQQPFAVCVALGNTRAPNLPFFWWWQRPREAITHELSPVCVVPPVRCAVTNSQQVYIFSAKGQSVTHCAYIPGLLRSDGAVCAALN
jgi:hypothetical protein